jgi:hypothetical protein
MPGRLCAGWGSVPVVAVDGGRGDGMTGRVLPAGGATVVEGDGGGGTVVPAGFAGVGATGGVTEIGGLGGGEGDEHVARRPLAPELDPDSWLPPLTVTSLSVRFTLAAHAHRLHDSLSCPTIVAPLPLTATGRVTTGKPPPTEEVPAVGTT